MATVEKTNLAVLIDTDNAQPPELGEILREAAKYGTATVKRAYGDWTTQNMSGWKKVLHVHSVQPMQQFSYTVGKNSTDSALIIDAMDILHAGTVNGFCLVSSDSDFTRLATRIRERGYPVYGFGERKTPQAFVAACNKFIFTESLGEKPTIEKPKKAINNTLREALAGAVAAATQDDGWAPLGAVGSLLNQNDPSFDSRKYGYKKLSDLIQAQKFLKVQKRQSGGGSQLTQIYVRVAET